MSPWEGRSLYCGSGKKPQMTQNDDFCVIWGFFAQRQKTTACIRSHFRIAQRGLDCRLFPEIAEEKPSVSHLESSLSFSAGAETVHPDGNFRTTIMCIQTTTHVYHRDTLEHIGEYAGHFITDAILDTLRKLRLHGDQRWCSMPLAGKVTSSAGSVERVCRWKANASQPSVHQSCLQVSAH